MPYGQHTAMCHCCGKRYQCGDSISQECDECLMERTRTDMSEQIQVRPGRWRMRNGEVIERVEPHETQSAYRWKGKGPGGFQYTWTDHGRFSVGDTDRPADLVEFLGEPEPEAVGHDGWIPIDPSIGGRLPTEEDGRACGGCFLLTRKDGSVSREYTLAFTSAVLLNGDAVAWMPDPLPKPFVPPAKVEEPKRLEGYFVLTTNIPMMTWRGPYMDEQVSLADDRPLTPQKFWREVRSGDVDPDAARRLVEDVNWTLVLAALREHWHGKAPMSMSTLEDRLAACRRKAASENVR